MNANTQRNIDMKNGKIRVKTENIGEYAYVYESNDFGKTWELVELYFTGTTWEKQLEREEQYRIQKELK